MSIKGRTTTPRQLTRTEREVEAAAERLSAQVEDALAAVAVHTQDGTDELEACADRLERAARDLAVALRELAARRGSGDGDTHAELEAEVITHDIESRSDDPLEEFIGKIESDIHTWADRHDELLGEQLARELRGGTD